jgi:transposase
VSEKRKYRTFTPEQKLEIVLAGLRGDGSVRDVCREHGVAETLSYQWRDRLEGGKAALATSRDRGTDPTVAELREAEKRVGQLATPCERRSWSGPSW